MMKNGLGCRGAAEEGDEIEVKVLLALEGVDPDFTDISGQTPQSWAAENGSEEVAKLLLATGSVNPNWKDSVGRTPLW